MKYPSTRLCFYCFSGNWIASIFGRNSATCRLPVAPPTPDFWSHRKNILSEIQWKVFALGKHSNPLLPFPGWHPRVAEIDFHQGNVWQSPTTITITILTTSYSALGCLKRIILRLGYMGYFSSVSGEVGALLGLKLGLSLQTPSLVYWYYERLIGYCYPFPVFRVHVVGFSATSITTIYVIRTLGFQVKLQSANTFQPSFYPCL